MEAKKIIVACGGTGGHAFPGLAVARELRARGHEVVVWDSGRSIESSVMKSWDGPVFSTGACQLRPRHILSILFSIFRCRREIRRFKPDALLAMGSYSSLPPVLAAKRAGVRIVLHEANTVPGRAVEWLSRYADAVAVSFEDTMASLPGRKTVLTGLPVRTEIAEGKRLEEVPTGAFCVFITGGSQGAHRVNEIASQAMSLLARDMVREGMQKLFVIHQTGAADEAEVRSRYEEAGIACRVCAFEQEMNRAFATADLVIARAGASTCFELALAGKPAFFIPLPIAVRDHQHLNAQAFVRRGAADEGLQDKLTPRSLANYVFNRVKSPEDLCRKAKAMKDMSMPKAAALVADLVEGKEIAQ